VRLRASFYSMYSVTKKLEQFKHRIGRVVVVGNPQMFNDSMVAETRYSTTGATVVFLTDEFFNYARSKEGQSQLDVALGRFADVSPTGVEPDGIADYLDTTGLETIFDEVVVVEPVNLVEYFQQNGITSMKDIDIDEILLFTLTSYNTRKA